MKKYTNELVYISYFIRGIELDDKDSIRIPDGEWKKIIFYNSGISALLVFNQMWIDKLKDVLKLFEENEEEIVLLWRFHPLIENALKSMRRNY